MWPGELDLLLLLCCRLGEYAGALGTAEQGRVEPVEHADVRDRQDQFKGVGVPMNDPFEQFRKNKSQGFTTRMKEKAEIAAEKRGGHRRPRLSPSPPPA